MKTLYTNVQIFNLICVECLEWHIAICFVRYIIFLPLLSASTSSSSRIKNVWQVSVRGIHTYTRTHVCVRVCVRARASVGIPRMFDNDDAGGVLDAHIGCVSEPSGAYECSGSIRK